MDAEKLWILAQQIEGVVSGISYPFMESEIEQRKRDAVALLQSAMDEETQALRAQLADLRNLAVKQYREWFYEVSNDYDHEPPIWANNLAEQHKKEIEALARVEAGKPECRGNECEDFGCETCPARK